MIAFKLFLITFIVVNIIDISTIIYSLQTLVAKILDVKNPLNIHLPLISCSYCVSWWMSIIYLILHNSLCLEYIALSIFFSAMTIVIRDAMLTLIELFKNILNIPNEIIDKN